MQQYDIITKALMEQSAKPMLAQFLGIRATDVELIEELPQETVSVKRSDYVLRITGRRRKQSIIIWEFLSEWRKDVPLNLLDYTVRAYLKFDLSVQPVILLLKSSPKALSLYERDGVRFQFTIIDLSQMQAADFLREADIHLAPFVSVMRGARQSVLDADRKIYESNLPTTEKAFLLTSMAILAGLTDKKLTLDLIRRRRDIMIQSAAYDIIKQEGIEEGFEKGELQQSRKYVREALKMRFPRIPIALLEQVGAIDSQSVLDRLFVETITARNSDEFEAVMTQLLKESA